MRENRRLSWIALATLLAAIAIAFVITGRLPLLNIFYLPVLLAAYWKGWRLASWVAALSVLCVALLVKAGPLLTRGEDSAAWSSLSWLNLFVWGCLLLLAGYASGTLMEHLREREPAAERFAASPEVRLYNIGTLAIIKGYLRHDQVLKILQIQQKNEKLFGEIAVGLRLLTPDQVDELLHLQREKRLVTPSEIAIAQLDLAKARKTR